jgi:hypothetical protein
MAYVLIDTTKLKKRGLSPDQICAVVCAFMDLANYPRIQARLAKAIGIEEWS